MKNVSLREYSKYFLISIFFILVILAFFLLKELFVSILGAFILAHFCFPIYQWLYKFIKNKVISSLLVVVGLIIIIALPLVLIIQTLITESTQVYIYINSLNLISNPTVHQVVERGFMFITQIASNFVLSIPNRIIGLVVMFFILYYLLKDGTKFINNVQKRIPMSLKQKNLLLDELKVITSGVGYGVILTGIIEGIIIAISFYFFGISSFVLWGFLATVLAILPAVGAAFIWIPAMFIQFMNGETWTGIGLLIVGLIVSGYFEVILKPKLIGTKAKIHPVIILLGVIGGLKFLGIVGLVFGPLILTTLLTLFNFVWKNEIKN